MYHLGFSQRHLGTIIYVRAKQTWYHAEFSYEVNIAIDHDIYIFNDNVMTEKRKWRIIIMITARNIVFSNSQNSKTSTWHCRIFAPSSSTTSNEIYRQMKSIIVEKVQRCLSSFDTTILRPIRCITIQHNYIDTANQKRIVENKETPTTSSEIWEDSDLNAVTIEH